MRGLMAIVVLVTALAAAIIVLAVVTFAPGLARAADKPQGRMQACTAQWLDVKADGHAPVYKTFIRDCLAGKAAEETGATQRRSKPALAQAHRAKAAPVKLSAKVKKPTRSSSGSKGPNRMSQCAAQWRERKATGTTGGQSYRQFSSQCLKAH